MNEKLLKTISAAGIWNLILGIVMIVTGVAGGVLLLVNAVRLMKSGSGLII